METYKSRLTRKQIEESLTNNYIVINESNDTSGLSYVINQNNATSTDKIDINIAKQGANIRLINPVKTYLLLNIGNQINLEQELDYVYFALFDLQEINRKDALNITCNYGFKIFRYYEGRFEFACYAEFPEIPEVDANPNVIVESSTEINNVFNNNYYTTDLTISKLSDTDKQKLINGGDLVIQNVTYQGKTYKNIKLQQVDYQIGTGNYEVFSFMWFDLLTKTIKYFSLNNDHFEYNGVY